MKKIFTTLAMAAFAMTSFAQATQQYWRVEFDMPIVNDGSGKTSVASGMKDDYTYCNPEHQYLDFQANGTLTARGEAKAMGFRSTTTNYSETSTFYLENGRTAQYNTSTKQETTAKYPYQVDHIKSITAYSIPVEKVELIDSVPFTEYKFPGNGKVYKGSLFTFNRLPRNVAELKTLMEKDGKRVEAGKNPLFVAAVFYLVCPRLIDCSQDCRDMMDYLFGTQYAQLNTYGVANATFQNWCIGSSFDQLDGGGFRNHNKIFQHFAGAKPSNQYKPNGKGYGYDNGPYTVRIVWDNATPTEFSGQMNATIARLLTMPNPDATEKADMSFEDPTAHLVKLRQAGEHWFMMDGEKIYMQKGKDQTYGSGDFDF